MPESIWEQLKTLLGLGMDVADVSALQMGLRTILIYAFTLAEVQRSGVQRALLSEQDLNEALRLQGKETSASQVQLAYLERNGASA